MGDKKDVTWEKLPSLSEPRQLHVSFQIRNCVVVLGGNSYKQYSSLVEAFNISDQEWEKSGKMPFPLYELSATTSNSQDFAIVFGKEDGFRDQITIMLVDEKLEFRDFLLPYFRSTSKIIGWPMI